MVTLKEVKEHKDVKNIKKDETIATAEPREKSNACTHNGLTHVFTFGKCKLWAGGAYNVNVALSEGMTMKALISLNGRRGIEDSFDPIVELSDTAKKVFKNTKQYSYKNVPSTISIDWPDGGKPPCDVEFFKDLLEDLFTIEGNVAIFCVGGHGRTGTALTVLGVLSEVIDVNTEDPVEWLRENYCGKSVETVAQINWLNNVAKVDTDATPSNAVVVKGAGKYTGWTYDGWHGYKGWVKQQENKGSKDTIKGSTDTIKGSKDTTKDLLDEDAIILDEDIKALAALKEMQAQFDGTIDELECIWCSAVVDEDECVDTNHGILCKKCLVDPDLPRQIYQIDEE